VLLDWALGKEQGASFAAARRAGFRERILVVTAGLTGPESLKALRQGVAGIFLKHNSPTLLLKAIRTVAGGEMWVDQLIIPLIAEGVYQRDDQGFCKSIAKSVRRRLTEREQMVLRSVVDGMTNKNIADQIGVSESSVKATIQQLFDKTQVRTRSQLVRVAMEGALPKIGKAPVGNDHTVGGRDKTRLA